MIKHILAGATLALTLASVAWADHSTDAVRDMKIEAMTVSQFVAECQAQSDDCSPDAGAVDDHLLDQFIINSVNTKGQPDPNQYCEPDHTTDVQRRDMLVAYFNAHPELASGALVEGAQKAFIDGWAPRCAEEKRAVQAAAARAAQTTVAQYLLTCQIDAADCKELTEDASGQAFNTEMGRMLNGQDVTYCPPRITSSALRDAVVGYLAAHSELASESLGDGFYAAMVALWPPKDKQC
ncbi:MAG: hypothetical protein P4M09_11185 [Devosia sp.]|nr:hypothetical protein [Devosia sp.]